jgi:2-keto-4-pentenoate hydratase/2-oxohepta-3-ene-1,7-dioic acid hydratase in catechol pathway
MIFASRAAPDLELITYSHDGSALRFGVVTGGRVVEAAEAGEWKGDPPQTMLDLLRRWDEAQTALAPVSAAGTDAGVPLAEVRLAAPIPRPGKIFALAQNYFDHMAEAGVTPPPKDARKPLVFCKLPSSVIGPDEPLVLPSVSETVDWELELAVVIGREARDIAEHDAMDVVAGYSIFNDISARTMSYPDRSVFGPTEEWFDFINGKWCDCFSIMGPSLVTADAIADPHDLLMRLGVDGVVYQDASTRDMIYGIPEVIAFISSWSTLEPGDVIATGTPAGTGYAHDRYLRAGDVIEATIDGLGTIRNPVVAKVPSAVA